MFMSTPSSWNRYLKRFLVFCARMIFRHVIFVKFMAATCSSVKPSSSARRARYQSTSPSSSAAARFCFGVVDGIIAAHGFLRQYRRIRLLHCTGSIQL